MKSIIIPALVLSVGLSFLIFNLTLAQEAPFTDDFETYATGDLTGQGNWQGAGGALSWQVTDERSFSGNKSIREPVFIGASFGHRNIKTGQDADAGIISFNFYTKDHYPTVFIVNFYEASSVPAEPYISLSSSPPLSNTIRLCARSDCATGLSTIPGALNYQINVWHTLTVEFDMLQKRARARLDTNEWSQYLDISGTPLEKINTIDITAQPIDSLIDNRFYIDNINVGAAPENQMLNPTEVGEVICGFRCYLNPKNNSFHEGLDINGSLVSTLVRAVADGRLVLAPDDFPNTDAGRWVWLNHGVVIKRDNTVASQISTRYLHLDTIDPAVLNLSDGDFVARGTIIGTIGRSGLKPTDIAHLHFEVRKGDTSHGNYKLTTALDPLVDKFVEYIGPTNEFFIYSSADAPDLLIKNPDGLVISKTLNELEDIAKALD